MIQGLLQPVIFHQEKSYEKKALELVDEYFYINTSYSRADIALKIVSYATLILPLIGLLLKAFLRWRYSPSEKPVLLPDKPQDSPPSRPTLFARIVSPDFFRPITFHKENRSFAEKALELVDEYFYLGGTGRMAIFKGDGPQKTISSFPHPYLSVRRSWMNVGLKTLSYATLILPLIGLLLKVSLRSHLNLTFTRKFEVGVVYNPNRIDFTLVEKNKIRTLPEDLQDKIASFLNYQDQSLFAKSASFAYFIVNRLREDHCKEAQPLSTKISKICRGALIQDEDLRQLLVDILHLKETEYTQKNVPNTLVDLMNRVVDYNTDVGYFGTHQRIANLLALSATHLSQQQFSVFLDQLIREASCFLSAPPWLAWRLLECYASAMPPEIPLPPATSYKDNTKNRLREHLTERAKGMLQPVSCLIVRGSVALKYQTVLLDITKWIGPPSSRYSMTWTNPHAPLNMLNASPSAADYLNSILFPRIQLIQQSIQPPQPLNVCVHRTDGFPLSSGLSLAYQWRVLFQKIPKSEIFLDMSALSRNNIWGNPLSTILTQNGIPEGPFSRNINSLSKEELGVLAQKYPDAVTSHS